MLAYYLAASSGGECTYLGPNMPADALADAVDNLNAQILVLSVIRERDDCDMVAMLSEIESMVPASTQILLGVGRYASLETQRLPQRIAVFESYEPYLVHLTALKK